MESPTGTEKHSGDLSNAICSWRASEAAAEQRRPWAGREPPVAPDLVTLIWSGQRSRLSLRQLSSASTAKQRVCSFVSQPSASIRSFFTVLSHPRTAGVGLMSG